MSAALWDACHRAARDRGPAPALALLAGELLPGMLPCGPHGHGVVAPETLLKAEEVWYGGRPCPLAPGGPEVLSRTELPGGEVVMVRHEVPSAVEYGPGDLGAGWGLGLVWLRLGLSEGLRESVVAHLGGRTTGGSPLLHQQLVKSAVADALIEHLEVRAVLDGARPAELSPALLGDLQRRLTATDRAQVKLLGASGYLRTGPGQVGYVSELLAEAYASAGKKEERAVARTAVAGSRCW
ncbi:MULTISPECIES: hypothetical protein [Streptomyces]|uniref:Acyl-CoA dehydrogenase/oxidase C-terminal domain-containing protein n=1 Tax=Streptomyces lycii TaxID=2654337 RepID=A0ABQ7FGJ3_9ACTN|nr:MULTISPECIES: hypothetical protein [Streptomyces]KAF4406774.1 hypothetical protein GCU69_23300 [Streptomyces lycii]PGH49849.1 hypothetical protein CRI70_15185 [Streptomyces sp. Ru87]